MLFVFLFLGLVLAVLLVGALMPSKYRVEKVTVVNRPVGEVKRKVGDLSNYANWNPWQQMDPAATKTITGNAGAIGHQYSWHGKKVGTGSLTIKSVENDAIHFDLEFLKPWKSHANDNWLFEEVGSQETKITWQNSGNLPWPMARLMGPMINKNLNHQFEKGLENLKKMLEETS